MEDYCVCVGMWFISLIAAGFWTLWCLIDCLYQDTTVGNLRDSNNPSKEDVRAARLARYEHVNSEITRYRDLVWKIAGYAWAIYFAIYTLQQAKRADFQGNPFLFLTASAASVYYTYCEVLTEQNRRRRLVLEKIMLLDETLRHRETGVHLFALVVSFIVFGTVIWIPVFVLWQ